jgi:small neutral amino acid transporter SnatA (MarC family)
MSWLTSAELMRSDRPTRTHRGVFLIAAAVVFLALAPVLMAGGIGRLIGGLWVSVLSVITGLIGGIFAG